jgi:hypothetical protein
VKKGHPLTEKTTETTTTTTTTEEQSATVRPLETVETTEETP